MNPMPLALAALVCAAPPGARAAVPAEGAPQPVRSGLFADLDVGGFFTAGGRSPADARTTSSPQAYLQLGLGYDLTRRLSLAVSLGLGPSAASCFASVRAGACLFDAARSASPDNLAPDNFTLAMLTLEASYKHPLTERLSIQPRLHLGVAALDPGPRRDAEGTLDRGLVVGAGVGVEYATHLDHLSVGADLFCRWVLGPDVLAFALYPKVKYTF